MRLEYNISNINQGLVVYLMKNITNTLKSPEMNKRENFFVDKELLFWKGHFDGNNFATMFNGHEKEGTIRYRDNKIRIPYSNSLKVFESKEYEENKPQRGELLIPKIVICDFKDLNKEEIISDGYSRIEEALKDMKDYYPDISMDSIISFYYFRDYKILNQE